MYLSFISLIAFVLSWGIVLWGILSSTSFWQVFINPASIIIVLGLTLTTLFISSNFVDSTKTLAKIFTVLIYQPYTAKRLRNEIMVVVSWANRVFAGGRTVYDEIAKENNDLFIKYLCSIVSTGYSEKEVKYFLKTNIDEAYSRDYSFVDNLNRLGGNAPAFGMLGTLIGLVVLLSQLDDPSKIGPAMAIALVTTFYGIILARIIFLPAAIKLSNIVEMSKLRKEILLEGVILIMGEKSSFYIEDKLNSYLDQFLKDGEKDLQIDTIEEET